MAQKTFKIVPKWRNFAKSGHTAPLPPFSHFKLKLEKLKKSICLFDYEMNFSPTLCFCEMVKRWFESVWPDCWIIYLIFAHLQHWKFANKISKLCQILNELFQNGQSFLTLCQSGEISPNLVTLVRIKESSLIPFWSFLSVNFWNVLFLILAEVWPDLAKFRHFGKKYLVIFSWLLSWTYFGNYYNRYWANVHICKRTNIEKWSCHLVTLLKDSNPQPTAVVWL